MRATLCPGVQSTNVHQVSAAYLSRSAQQVGPRLVQVANWSRQPLSGDSVCFLLTLSVTAVQRKRSIVCVCMDVCLYMCLCVCMSVYLCVCVCVFSPVQFSRVRLFVTLWTAARQASLSIINSWSSPKPMSIESVMPSNHLILCRSLLLLPSIFPSIRVFSNEPVLRIRWPKFWLCGVQDLSSSTRDRTWAPCIGSIV